MFNFEILLGYAAGTKATLCSQCQITTDMCSGLLILKSIHNLPKAKQGLGQGGAPEPHTADQKLGLREGTEEG